MRILIGSAGRRVYLIEWFRRALEVVGVDGEIHITENNPMAVASAFADQVHILPAYRDEEYEKTITDVFETVHPDLYFSLNDHELTVIAGVLGQRLQRVCRYMPMLAAATHRIAADKFEMSSALDAVGIRTPPTVLAANRAGVRDLARSFPMLVVKQRFGSGSAGLQVVPASRIDAALTVLAPDAGPSPTDWIVQPRIEGREYGIDVVAPLAGCLRPAAVLARRKVAMRAGETNVATTVDPSPFLGIGDALAGLLTPRGMIDVDLLETDDDLVVLDINPRFGGGYPFNHQAGADVPAFYVSQAAGIEPPHGWNTYEIGTTAAKFDCLATVPSPT